MFVPAQIVEEPTFITAPTIRVGVAHPFLANLIKEIGGTYVSVITIKEPNVFPEDTTEVCHGSIVFFGLTADVDGWVKELCGTENNKTAVIFLDTYVHIGEQGTTTATSSTERNVLGDSRGYYWLTTQGGKDMARVIAKVLSEIDPVHKVSYLDASYSVAYQLDDLFGSIKDKIYNIRVSPVIAWGNGWGGIVEEYGGKITKIIDTPQSDQERDLYVKQIAQDLMHNTRTVVVGDMSLPFDELKKIYRDGGRRVVILDPWGDFSDIWPYKVFVQQNLLRITQAL